MGATGARTRQIAEDAASAEMAGGAAANIGWHARSGFPVERVALSGYRPLGKFL